MNTTIRGRLLAEQIRLAVVAARFNDLVTTRLVAGALDAFSRLGGTAEQVPVVWVPGAFELPLAVQTLATGKEYDAILALGVVIKGETPHFDHVSNAAIRGLSEVMLRVNIPIGCGVLTCEDTEQALARAGGKAGNKGAEALHSVVEMANLLRLWREEGVE